MFKIFDRMKILFFLAILVFVALTVAHSDTEQNDLLARETREAGRRNKAVRKTLKKKKKSRSKRRKGKKGRKGSIRKQKKRERKLKRKMKGRSEKMKQSQGTDACVTKFRLFDLELVQTNLRKDIKVNLNEEIMISKRGKV